MRKRSFGQWLGRVEYWMLKLPFTVGALFDWVLQRTVGVGLPLDWSEFEVAEIIRKRTVFYHGRRMAPHSFKLSIGWQQYKQGNGRTLAEWEAWLVTAAKNEISRQDLLVFAPVQARASINIFADKLRVEASYGEFEKTLLSERQQPQMEPGTADRPFTFQGCYRLTIHSSAGEQQRLLVLKPGKDRLYLGCSRDCDVVVSGDGVSPIHAVLYLDAQGRLLLADVGSQTGTWIKNRRLERGETATTDDECQVSIGSAFITLCKEII